MRVLAVDTVTEQESVALLEDGVVRGLVGLSGGGIHSRRLMPSIAFLLENLDLEADRIDGFAVTAGPGSFTGLRIGMSTVQGMALPGDRPCFQASALDVLGALAGGEAVAAMIDTSRAEVFATLYPAGRREPPSPPVCEPPEVFLARVPAGTRFVGSGALRWAELISRQVPGASIVGGVPFLAEELGRQATRAFERGEGIRPAELRPLYVRGVHIRGRS